MSETGKEPAAIRNLIGWSAGWELDEVVLEPAIPVLASPSWRGVDGAPWRAVRQPDGASLFIKVMDADAVLYIDIPCAFEAAGRASDLGIGPKVLAADAEAGILVMEDLNAGWRVGGLERMREPGIVDAIIAARQAFQQGAPLPRRATVFDEIERFYAAAQEANARLPSDTAWMTDEIRFAAEALKGLEVKEAPIHGDGNVSNIMISDAGEVRLVDWDRATTADPLEDLGSFLVEAFAQEPEARDAFSRAFGSFDEGSVQPRARLWRRRRPAMGVDRCASRGKITPQHHGILQVRELAFPSLPHGRARAALRGAAAEDVMTMRPLHLICVTCGLVSSTPVRHVAVDSA